MNLELAGKACLVAGASRGIGRAIALALVREGARVCGVARGKDELDKLEVEATVVADVSTAQGASAAVDGAVAALGGLDVVVTNVGKSFAREASQMDDDDLAKSLDLNLWTAARVAQRAVPHLAKTRGSITMVSSIWGREAGGAPAYNAAKAAEISFTTALAREVASQGITVNCIAPGSILWEGGGWYRRRQADPEGIAEFVSRDMPLGRFGEVREVADVVTFICSQQASLLNGACIAVDGGQSRSNI